MENSGIEWTDHTFNPWIGCTKISPGCDHCYAESWDSRFSGGEHWGPGAPRRVTSKANWSKPGKWNRSAEITGKRPKVFSASLADVCDNEAPEGAREMLWIVIRETPHLTWQLLTKRGSLITKFVPEVVRTAENVWMGVTVDDNENGLRRAEQLIATDCKVKWLSVEPLLERLDPARFIEILSGIDWVVLGGESGPGARPLEHNWVEDVIWACRRTQTPLFFKQWGNANGQRGEHHGGCMVPMTGQIGAPAKEIKEFPNVG